MKKILSLFTAAIVLISCSGATDGDPNTDTTTLTIDTGGLHSPDDTTDHINTNTGEYPKDTISGGKTDVRSSTGTDPKSRSTTPGNDTTRKKQ